MSLIAVPDASSAAVTRRTLLMTERKNPSDEGTKKRNTADAG
jgi:hypothetical protein